MTKKINLEDIIMLLIITLVLPGLAFGFVTFCVFIAYGLIAGVIATAVLAFLIGFMFGMELINMI